MGQQLTEIKAEMDELRAAVERQATQQQEVEMSVGAEELPVCSLGGRHSHSDAVSEPGEVNYRQQIDVAVLPSFPTPTWQAPAGLVTSPRSPSTPSSVFGTQSACSSRAADGAHSRKKV